MHKSRRICDNNKEQYGAEDRINQLPDEILVSLLSLLTVKEAARTSLLSRQWRNLWTFTTRLEFEVLKDIDRDPAQRSNFVEWVNWAMDSLKSQNLEVFRLSFCLNTTYKHVVDKWIMFAFRRRVQRFELDLSDTRTGQCYANTKLYELSYEMILPSKLPFGLPSLKDLCLKGVNVNDDVLHFFLSNCPLLERLSVCGSRKLVNLKVVGQSLPLKFLEIRSCYGIQSIEINDVNIVTFIYKGIELRVLLKNVPKLINLSLGGMFYSRITDVLPCFSSCHSKLETLTIYPPAFQKFIEFRVCELTKLKILVLEVISSYDRTILDYTCFVKAAPFLQKLVLQVRYHNPAFSHGDIMRKADECHHEYLEELEFRGFCGEEADLQVVAFFLKNSIPLNKIVIDPQEVARETKVDRLEAARMRAEEHLRPILPSRVQLIIL